MAKKKYFSPMLLDEDNPFPIVSPTTVPYGPSQGEYDDNGSPADQLPDSDPEEDS